MRKKIMVFFMFVLAFVYAWGPMLVGATEFNPLEGLSSVEINPSVYDPDANYMDLIMEVLNEGGPDAMQKGQVIEDMRNLKIDDMGLDAPKTTYFTTFSNTVEILHYMETGEELSQEVEVEETAAVEKEVIETKVPEPTPEPQPETEPKPKAAPKQEAAPQLGEGTEYNALVPEERTSSKSYTDDDLYWLSRAIYAEAGSHWIPDWVQQHVGSVVMNRAKDRRFANSIKGVIFQPGQYYCVKNGAIYYEPSAKAVANARYILENGPTLPAGVVGQSEFVQGQVYAQYYDQNLGSTTYFCYM
jgi:Cell wall hydrolyses involved in spore germination